MICSFLVNNLRHMFVVLIFLCLRTILREPDRKKRKKGLLILHLKKQVFSASILETTSWLAFHDWFPMKFVFTNNISLVCWEISKRRSKVQEKNVSCEQALNIDQWKTFSENYKAMRAWLCLSLSLFTNLPRIIVARDFSPSSFQLGRGILPLWQSTYPNLKTTRHIKLKFSLWTKLL